MKYGIVYIVLKEGEVIFADVDEERANTYAFNCNNESVNEILENEWEIEDSSEKDIQEAAFQAGYDGEYYEVKGVDITNLTDDDTTETFDGEEIDVSDVLRCLKSK